MKDSILDLEALLRVPYVDPDWGFDISPDGEQVAFAWNPTGQWEIYVVPLSGKASPRQVTAGPGAKFAPRWSPGGQWLAYVVDLDGGEMFDIYACDLATGQHTNLTPETPAAIQPNFSWSPDGSKIAFISDRSGCFDTYVMDVRSSRGLSPEGEPRLMLSLSHPNWEVDWSPDGGWLAVTMEAAGQDYWTAIVPAEAHHERAKGTGEPCMVTDPSMGSPDHPGAPLCAKDACWSPDSTRIAFSSDLHGFYNVGIYELKTGRVTWVTEGEGDKERPAWSPDGQRLACVASDGPAAGLAVVDLGDRSLTTHQVEPGIYYRPRFTPNGEHLVFVFDNPRHPDELWALSADDGSFRQLTHSLPPELGDSPFVMPMEVRYPSMDGQLVPGLLYAPRDSEELPPAVVTVHGGPTWLTQVTWDPLIQHMVSRGWIVLAPNYRGSTGYGREWQLASRFDFGGGETQDVVAGADYLAREGLADPARIAVTGTSWGGYLTMTSLTQYPDRWAAGSAVVPFLNWFTCHVNSREDLQHWDVENFGDPLENHSLYYERSPFFFLDRITAPVQLICGAHDVRCPASESTQARDELLARGKECDFVLYEDEGHGFLKTENVVDAKLRRVAFLARVFQSETKKVDRLFAAWDRPGSPGCALGVVRDGELIYARGYGMANLEHSVPISSRTVFRIASTSKQFTAMCIALLAEQARISLDDDIRTYLPELPAYKRPITIRHLIHHTSGLRDYLELMELAGMRDEDFYTDDDVLEMMARQKALSFAPGGRYLYSNSGYYLLGVIVSRVSGQSLRAFAEEHIFRPLGMVNTHFHDDHREIVPHRATGYSPNKEEAQGGYRIDMTSLDMVGDGGVFTTVEDLSLWDQNFYRNRLGQGGDALIRQVLTPGTLNNGEPLDYAFGLVAGDHRGLRMISHSGGFVGFRAEMIRFPEQRFSVICLANLSTINPSRLARQVAGIYLADQLQEEPETSLLAEPWFLEDKAGVYWSRASRIVVELSLENGRLMAEMFGEKIQIAPVTEMDFVTVAAPFDAEIRFERPDQGGAWLMHIREAGERPETLEMIEVVSPSTGQLAECAGKYTSEELRVTYQLVLEEGSLFVRHRSAPKDPLKPGFSDMFWVGAITLLFTRDDAGRISGFTLDAGRVKKMRFVRSQSN